MTRHIVSSSRYLALAAWSVLAVACSQQEVPGDAAGPAKDGPDNTTAALLTGTLPDGSDYRIDMPSEWNGTLLLDLDYVRRATEESREPVVDELLARGYAIGGTTRAIAGWAIHQSVENLVRTKAIFVAAFGEPRWAVAFGRSMGGHTAITAIETRPDQFDAAVSLCGAPAGAVGLWNSKLDALFVSRTLLAPDSDLPIMDVPDDFAETARPAWLAMLADAQATPEGRARIALAAVLAQLPEWSVNDKPMPAADDIVARQEGLYDSLAGGPLPAVGQAMSSRNQIRELSGGNISWNVGVDYGEMLQQLNAAELVEALYGDAGLSLETDLQKLADAPRISADPEAVAYMRPQVISGDLQVPVITLHDIGDQISPVSTTRAFAEAVARANKANLLRQVYTEAAGHCRFSVGETVASVEVMRERLMGGEWPDTSAAAMNRRAARSGETANYIEYRPEPFLRAITVEQLDRAQIR